MNAADLFGPVTPPPEHAGEWTRLKRLLEGAAGRFALVLAGYNRPVYRDQLIERLRQDAGEAAHERLDANGFADFAAFERWLEHHGQAPGALHLVGLDLWLGQGKDDSRLYGFNVHRDWIARLCRRPLVLWLLEHQIREFAQAAPDAWEWRSGVVDFSWPVELESMAWPEPLDLGSATRDERLQRIGEIRDFLAYKGEELSGSERGILGNNLGYLYRSLGEWIQALNVFGYAANAFQNADDQKGVFKALAESAEILGLFGDLDEALGQLNLVFEGFREWGDAREMAITQGRIADILKARGQLDEALRILREEELPVYERLGDVREKAVVQGRIADILQEKGQLNEALSIRQQEQLPVYERLGDVRSKAMVQGKIADILLMRGEMERALHIYHDDLIPTFAIVGDIRSQAVTQGRVADILQARGQLDEALRIREEEELPIYKLLGDVSSTAVTLFKIAGIELEQKQFSQAFEHLGKAYEIFTRLQVPDGLATVGEHYGQLLRQRGDPEKGIAILKTALEAAEALGQTARAERLRNLLSQPGTPLSAA
ncbi:Tetratricopeptide repeat-containing protein [Methylomagnum ishizawai]|uniref:Tetratricopeptide repeat-containing protein n=1 Tax=Methylomagnum ishizawai TaxID=1760988 RepID=A0A1Y6D034_9GAMM|nr:tetratricopeptide repeat protein [Methylomagnum ishizawai]SMF96299.1 Tetratricopeptide repeat-containing protein [Methylomagnum ishizawai]